jgi:hypothetical protein
MVQGIVALGGTLMWNFVTQSVLKIMWLISDFNEVIWINKRLDCNTEIANLQECVIMNWKR